MKKRLITAIIMIAVGGFVFYFQFLLIPSLIIYIFCFLEITHKKKINFWTYLALVQSLGILLINAPEVKKILYVADIVVMNDSMSYLGGKFCNFGLFKRHPFPKLSPHKTYGGYIYGLLSVILVSIVLSWSKQFDLNIFKSIIITIFGVLGDLLNSKFKRNHCLKNSGEGLFTEKVFNGHGGAYDRFDSISLALIAGLIIL